MEEMMQKLTARIAIPIIVLLFAVYPRLFSQDEKEKDEVSTPLPQCL